MSQRIYAKVVNGALVPLEPLGIEEGATVAFILVGKAPPGVELYNPDHAGNEETDLPGQRPKFRVPVHHAKFLPGADPKKLKQILDDEEVESYLKAQGDSQ